MNKFFQTKKVTQSVFSGLLIISLLVTLIPTSVLAAPGDTDTGQPSTTATSTVTGTETTPDTLTASSTDSDTGTSTASTTDTDIPPVDTGTSTATSTETSSSTATSTATSTPPSQDGQSGTNGSTGGAGQPGESVIGSITDSHNPVATSSDALLGDDTESGSNGLDQEDEVITGEIIEDGGNITIETATATAKAEIFTDANSNDVRSELTSEAAAGDLDIYTFNATGTNNGVAQNEGDSKAVTGGNTAVAANSANIKTGGAVAVINVANIINTSVVNSDGIIYLGNQILSGGESLDLTRNFFPDPNKHKLSQNVCSLMSCAAEDIIYNFSQQNTATITNDINVEASTGKNLADGYRTISDIRTGRAFASGNVMNVANTNIIDSNYQLLAFNAIGDLDGDLILPTEDLFMAYFAQPNGTNQVESAEDVVITINNTNIANDVSNNLNSYAETGQNQATTSYDSTIKTGQAYTESNILNKINENSFGGDLFELRIRIHGNWDGEIVDLPAGLSWEYTADGIRIYNQNAEIATSPNIGYDIDSYRANITNRNEIILHNNISLSAITGQNKALGWYGNIETGDAFASANVMNIANTNIIGVNWTYAVVNILGDLKGNISFSTPTDLTLTGSITSGADTLAASSTLIYTYTVTNNSTVPALDVSVEQSLTNAFVNGSQTNSIKSLGNIGAHGTKQVIFTAVVDPALAVGTSSVVALATVRSQTADSDFSNNILTLQNDFTYSTSSTAVNGSSTGTGASTSTGSGTSTTPVENPVVIVPPPSSGGGGSSSGGGGGGGGSSSKYTKKDIEREELAVDANKPPLITITKTAKVGKSISVRAGDSVDYTIVVKNKGGQAYDATVYDVLSNPIGAELNQQDWYLGTIKAGEEIKLTYTTEYDLFTPSGIYTNTASIVAYATKPEKNNKTLLPPLKISDAVYELKINGVPLAVGNVAVLAFFPGAFGQVSALLSWETSTSSISQIVYGPRAAVSSYTPGKLNYGYQNSSFRFPIMKTRHFMIITNLQPGQTYDYRANAISTKSIIVSREYGFRVPHFIPSLTLATASDNLLTPPPQVAGASTTAQISPPY